MSAISVRLVEMEQAIAVKTCKITKPMIFFWERAFYVYTRESFTNPTQSHAVRTPSAIVLDRKSAND